MPRQYVRKFRVVPRVVPTNYQDWPAVVLAIVRARVSKARIAASCGLSREKLYSLLSGRYEPTWSEGHALIALLSIVEDAPVQSA